MLQTILAAFRQHDSIVSLATLSRQLGVEPSALEGMLTTLIRKGRIAEVTHDQGACHHCLLHEHCNPGTATTQKLYVLAEKTASGCSGGEPDDPCRSSEPHHSAHI